MTSFFSNRALAITGLLLTCAFWASNIIVSKLAISLLPPISLNFWRWVTAAIILLPWTISGIRQHWPEIKRHKLILACFGFLGVSLYNSLLYSAAHSTASVNIAVISTLTPVLTFLLGWAIFKVLPTRYQWLGFALGLSGVLLMVAEGQWSRLLGLQIRLGDLWMLLASISWALYTVLQSRGRLKLPPIIFLQITILFGVILTVPMVLWEWAMQPAEFASVWSWQLLLIVLYTGIFPSVLAYGFWNYGVSILGSNTAVVFLYLLPVMTAIMGFIWLGETVRWYHIVGQLLVFAGFYCAVMLTSKKEPVRTVNH